MPPYYHTRRTSGRQLGSNTNAFGYDPDGRVTHVAQHMFGPWTPHVLRRARFSGHRHAPPQYGPPTVDQVPWLPTTFVPQSPPPYHGIPCAPYLPPPLYYDPVAFSALVSRPRKHQIERVKLVEEDALVVEATPWGALFMLDLEIPLINLASSLDL